MSEPQRGNVPGSEAIASARGRVSALAKHGASEQRIGTARAELATCNTEEWFARMAAKRLPFSDEQIARMVAAIPAAAVPAATDNQQQEGAPHDHQPVRA
jgi:hypothetical protein